MNELDFKRVGPPKLSLTVWEECEPLRAELAAARAEIERLSKSCIYEAQQWAKWSAEKNQQLAAEQAKNVMLREAIDTYGHNKYCKRRTAVAFNRRSTVDCDCYMREALSTPSDTSALESYVAKAGEKMRERCEAGAW